VGDDRRSCPGRGSASITALLALVLTSCANMLAPSPDGVVWLYQCDVGKVTADGLELVTRGDAFCPSTIEVDSTGVIWGAGNGGEVRLVAEDRWVRVLQNDSQPEEVTSVIDIAIGTDGRVWLVTGSGEEFEEVPVMVHSFDGNTWRTFPSASGTSFGTVVDRIEPPDRVLAPLPRGRMVLATSDGLFFFTSARWVRILPGEFTSVSSTADGAVWIAGPSGVYTWSAEDVVALTIP
jgi:ligand-binding sensor domain-containing protein